MASERLTARGFEVPTSLLRSEWPPNDGLRPGDERFDVILASIREEGIREPLTIKRDWTIIDGSHRFFAALLLGLASVPVVVWTGREMVGLEAATPAPAEGREADQGGMEWLVDRAIRRGEITVSRGAEILGLSLREWRQRAQRFRDEPAPVREAEGIDDLLDEMSPTWVSVERAIWPNGPASGHGSGAYAGLKARIIAALARTGGSTE